jgi:beta-N-acetylhexosaminidase
MGRLNTRLVFIRTQRRLAICLCVFVLLGLSTGSITLAQNDPLANLSLEQRVAQMFMVNLYGNQLTEAGRDFLTRWQPGGVVLLPENITTPNEVTQLTNTYQQTITEHGGFPLFITIDQEGGMISHLRDGFTVFPVLALLTATGDVDLAERVGQAMAQEMLAVGINMDLAPVADLETNPNNPIIKRRAFGNDAQMTSPILAGFIKGMQGEGLMATAKHFPGHGDSSSDSHVGLPVISLTRERLESVELVPFRAAIEAGVSTVMVAHIYYPALEPQKDLPASMSHSIVTGLLREEMGYRGLVITDALDMDAIDTIYSYPNAALNAIKAGVDLVIAAHVSLEAEAAGIQAVVEAVQSGEIPEARINESVRRILEAKERYGILNWKALDPNSVSERLNLEAHAPLVDELFAKGVTVALDERHVIPFQTGQRVGVIFPGTRPQIQQDCVGSGVDVRALAVHTTPTEDDIASAKRLADQVDTVVVFTQNADADLQEQALVKALPADKTVAVALASVYDWTVYPQVSGYALTYSPLPQAVPAVCGVLFGKIPANGRLSIKMAGLP